MKKIVTIGGGTGGYTVLSGIKNISNISISAIVAMTDDGGSTGVLRDELGVLPPGDVRQCLVALSEQTEMVRKLISYRFEDGGLAGHSFGNIFLAGLEKVTGSFAAGVEVASDILKVKGKVIPITDREATLEAILNDGTVLLGENEINHSNLEDVGVKKLVVNKDATINEHARNALEQADFILIGPGNHYCSILPSLVVKGCKEVFRTTQAKILYIVNLTNKKGHTLGWGVKKYVDDIEKHIGKPVDFILINSEKPSPKQVQAYELLEGDGVLVENDLIGDTRIINAPLISKKLMTPHKADAVSDIRSFIRHDSSLLQKEIEKIVSLKLVFDFDNTIFDVETFKSDRLFKSLSKYGIPALEFKDHYLQYRKKHVEYDIKEHLLEIIRDKKLSVDINHLIATITSNLEPYVFREYKVLLKKYGKENCFILTQGDEIYQRLKISSSGIENDVGGIFAVNSTKKEKLEELCEKWKNENIMFFDDKFSNLDFETEKSNLIRIFTGDADSLTKENLKRLLKRKIKICSKERLFAEIPNFVLSNRF